jgi:hypothetical protein
LQETTVRRFMDPLLNKFVMPIESYDVTLLPEDKRDPNSPDFRLAISEQLTSELTAFGARSRIIVGPELRLSHVIHSSTSQ